MSEFVEVSNAIQIDETCTMYASSVKPATRYLKLWFVRYNNFYWVRNRESINSTVLYYEKNHGEVFLLDKTIAEIPASQKRRTDEFEYGKKYLPRKIKEEKFCMESKEVLEFLKMNVYEKQKLRENNPEKYNELVKAADLLFPKGEE